MTRVVEDTRGGTRYPDTELENTRGVIRWGTVITYLKKSWFFFGPLPNITAYLLTENFLWATAHICFQQSNLNSSGKAYVCLPFSDIYFLLKYNKVGVSKFFAFTNSLTLWIEDVGSISPHLNSSNIPCTVRVNHEIRLGSVLLFFCDNHEWKHHILRIKLILPIQIKN